MPRITIIETGLVSPQFRERHGSYPQMFQRMVAAADPSIACDVVSVANGLGTSESGHIGCDPDYRIGGRRL